MSGALPLLAQATDTVSHRFARIQFMTEWWHWLLLLSVCAAVVVYIVAMYWIDSTELRRGVAASLLVLRVLAFAAILFFFLDLEKRTEVSQVKTSRLLLLVDTSQSMGLRDGGRSSVDAVDDPEGRDDMARIDPVISALEEGDLLEQFRRLHDVVVYRFDDDARPQQIAAYGKTPAPDATGDDDETAAAAPGDAVGGSRTLALVGGAFLAVSALAGLVFLIFGRGASAGEKGSWSLLVSMMTLIIAIVLVAVATLRAPDVPLLAVLGFQDPPPRDASLASEEEDETIPDPVVDWNEELLPRGTSTRMADAVRSLVQAERGGPIAGILVLTDGRGNAGARDLSAATAARSARIPLFAVGLGSNDRPINARVIDLESPRRVYPQDRFSLTGYVQGYGLSGKSLTAELYSIDLNDPDNALEEFEDSRPVEFTSDGQVISLAFDVTPAEEGRRQYRLRVSTPPDDIDPEDNERGTNVEIVDSKNQVLLFAGGPTREYRFLRTQLFRDRDTTLHVLLQSGLDGLSQEADAILTDFPTTADELFEYDTILAFDPDWLELTDLQIELLDRWISEKAGGLIVVAGPVHTSQWASLRRGRDSRVDTLRAIYPVVFYSQNSPVLNVGRFGGEAAWPLAFTRDGLDAEFLWLEEDAQDSETEWANFRVYGYYAVKDPKPGARVYSRFSDPETSIDGELPIYHAGHFYGAGRVFFQASGEMWRLRAVDERFFEQYYTKLIRWASQGRLLRESSHGVLLTDKDRCLLGDHVVVRAILTDAQYLPLTDPQVPAILVQPDGARTALTLERADNEAREGTYVTQFTTRMEGDYRIELAPPQAPDEELLTRDVRVRLPTLEMEQPERNDAGLQELTDRTGGKYFVGMEALNPERTTGPTLYSLIEPRDQHTHVGGTPDLEFDQRLMGWLMVLMCGVLSLEWLIRRLNRLA